MDKISLVAIFFEGLLSFISPCVLPLIPVYMSYLTSSCRQEVDGEIKYQNSKVILTTIFFVLGISTTFFLMGLSLDFIKDFINDYTNIISLIGGMVLIIFALNGFGIINISFLNQEYRIDNKLDLTKMNYLKAYVFGFLFSFAWTPCIGPMLANVILVASSVSAIEGNLYILLYALGFTIPFLLLGIFYKYGLEFIAKKKQVLIQISKIASLIILFFGVTMIIDGSNEIIKIQNDYQKLLASNPSYETSDSEYTMMYEFDLLDQYGKRHTLKDYEGKYVMLNFIASWCGYCEKEIPAYQKFSDDQNDDLAVLYVMSEKINSSNGGSDTQSFIDKNDITIPVLNDDGTMYSYLGISGFPMMVIIGPDGTLIGYQSGMLDYDGMNTVYTLAKQMFKER